MPAPVGYTIPSFIRQPERAERAKTPMPEEPIMEDDAPVVPSPTPEIGTQGGLSLPRLELAVPMISYENQGMCIFCGPSSGYSDKV
jgi:hypothetical protein